MSDVTLLAETNHTPGPWKYRDEQGREEVWIGVPGQAIGMKVIATVQYGFTPPANLEQQANARLIAAAPELYQICREVLDWVHGARPGRCVTDDMTQRLFTAIAKAEGKPAVDPQETTHERAGVYTNGDPR